MCLPYIAEHARSVLQTQLVYWSGGLIAGLKRGQLFHPFHPVLGLPKIVLQIVWISLIGY